jgi:hypothetical protein
LTTWRRSSGLSFPSGGDRRRANNLSVVRGRQRAAGLELGQCSRLLLSYGHRR